MGGIVSSTRSASAALSAAADNAEARALTIREQAQAQAAALKEQAQAQATAMQDKAQSKAAELKDQAQAQASAMQDQAQAQMQSAQDRAAELQQQAQDQLTAAQDQAEAQAAALQNQAQDQLTAAHEQAEAQAAALQEQAAYEDDFDYASVPLASVDDVLSGSTEPAKPEVELPVPGLSRLKLNLQHALETSAELQSHALETSAELQSTGTDDCILSPPTSSRTKGTLMSHLDAAARLELEMNAWSPAPVASAELIPRNCETPPIAEASPRVVEAFSEFLASVASAAAAASTEDEPQPLAHIDFSAIDLTALDYQAVTEIQDFHSSVLIEQKEHTELLGISEDEALALLEALL